MAQKRKILLTGAGGFVGSRVRTMFSLREDMEVRVYPGEILRSGTRREQQRIVEEFAPDVIIHTAAISDMGACDKDPLLSRKVNVELTQTLAFAAKKSKARLVAFSTDQVYNGCTHKGPYSENDTLAPINVYAKHKLEAEQTVLQILPETVFLRATWMYDMPLWGSNNRGNFFMNELQALATGESITVMENEYRGITYVRQVALLLDKAAELPGGAYNFGSETVVPMEQLARHLFEELGAGERAEQLIKVKARENGPRNLWFSCKKLKDNGLEFYNTLEGLSHCVRDYGLKFR